MNPKRVIIERPDLQSPLQRATSGGLTFIFWIFWIYLWLPLISLVAWWLGIKFFRENLLDNQGYKILFEHVGFYAAVIGAIAVFLIGWGRYNLARFRDKERRKAVPVVDHLTHARDFKIDPQQLTVWQVTKHLTIHHDEDGHITSVESGRSIAVDDTAAARSAPPSTAS